MKDYKRLTDKDEKGFVYLKTWVTTRSCCERLAALEDKIENGMLIEMPYKVGTWLYYVFENSIHKCKVEEMWLSATKDFDINNDLKIFAYDFKNERQLHFYYGGRLTYFNTKGGKKKSIC